MKYTPSKIEKKWQKYWDKKGIFKNYSRKEKFYVLDMFPYPSGVGLHVGHPKGFIATDIIARYQQMQGKSVLHPMGWDAFGLPAENYALKNNTHPRISTEKNVARYKEQLQSIGFTYDWDREINTTDPEYYKWTQWIFLKMFKQGLAFESYEPINWCPSCKTGLANEDLEEGKCERCGSEIEQRPMRQWVLKMTDYADRLLHDLDMEELEWEESIVDQQKNWIGRSEGVEIYFPLRPTTYNQSKEKGNKQQAIGNKETLPSIKVFTTRVDTIFGCTYIVLAPEHEMIKDLEYRISNVEEVRKYVERARKKTTMERTELAKEKTGVELKGVKAVNPFNGEEVPVFVADYVLASYGTGAVMAVPAHDERDFEFAKKYNLSLRYSIAQEIGKNEKNEKKRNTSYGIIQNEKGEVLVQFLKKYNRWALPGGGIKHGEDEEEGLLREIREETGYVDCQVGEKVGVVKAHYFGKYFKRFTCSNTSLFQVKLLSGKQERVMWDDAEKEIGMEHSWVSLEEALQYFSQDTTSNVLFFHLFERYLAGKYYFTQDGVLIESGEFTGLTSSEAREKMAQWLEETGCGKRTVNYKMRDWVFSRQRYWGEPIPIVHCEGCADKEIKTQGEIHFRNDAIWEAIISGEKTLETRALNPEEPNRYFGNIKKGNFLRLVNKNSHEEKVYVVTDVYTFKSLEDLFEKKDILAEIWSGKIPETIEEMRNTYAMISPEYLEKIKHNGLVAWKIQRATQAVGIPEDQLPVVLPEVEQYEPTGTGESPLSSILEWVNTVCPQCGGPAKRETNTMPSWAGSSWYYLAYIMKGDDSFQIQNSKFFPEWLPVNLYVGGAEHATRHLLYARFWHKFLFDIGVVPTKEPFKKLMYVGLINASDGRKMSKRWNNVINPDDVIAEFGADSLRLYEMFMGPFSQSIAWNTEGVSGVRRFLEKVWKLSEKLTLHEPKSDGEDEDKEVTVLLHKTIKKVTEDIENFRFNTAISALMILVNYLEKEKTLSQSNGQMLVKILSPFAPHITEELWENMGHTTSIFLEKWPEWDEKLIVDEMITLVVQVNGKVRDTFPASADISENNAKELALASEKVQKFIDGRSIRKVIFVKGKLVNIVV